MSYSNTTINSDFVPLYTKSKLKLHSNSYTLHNDVCKREALFGVI